MLTTLRILVDNFLCETSELYVLGKQTKHIYGMGKVRNVWNIRNFQSFI